MNYYTDMYCDKCGKLWKIHITNDREAICEICKNVLKIVPDNYFESFDGILFISKEMEQKLIKDLVLTSSNFDSYYFDNKDKIKSQQDREYFEKMKHGRAIINEQSNIPKCPTCSSANVEKISTGKKVFGGAMFGLFSSDVRNTMHCRNCGYKW